MTDRAAVSVIQYHQCISGFTQSQKRLHGVLKLSEQLHQLGYNNRISRVSLRPWNSDWADVAENIWLIGQHHQADVVVNIYAYSWGGGWGAPRLARELGKRNVSVHTIVTSDAVHRSSNLLLRWRSMLKRSSRMAPVIEIPDNVEFVKPFHQVLNRPQGHEIVGSKTFSGRIDASAQVHATHQYMDDSKAFHRAALKAAQSLQNVQH